MAKLILALDKQGWDIATEQLNTYINCGVAGIKITAAALFNGVYNHILTLYEQNNFPKIDLFLDLKVADISFGQNQGTNYKIVEAVAKAASPVTHISIHGFLGWRATREAVAGANDRINVLVLAAMTDDTLYAKLNPYKEQRINTAQQTGYMAEDEGAFGVILPANDLTLVRNLRLFKKIPIWSPGFGRQDQDQHVSIHHQLEEWRKAVGNHPENAAIIGTHLLVHHELEKEVMRIKGIIG